jgi:hypothetical protein
MPVLIYIAVGKVPGIVGVAHRFLKVNIVVRASYSEDMSKFASEYLFSSTVVAMQCKKNTMGLTLV